MYKNIENLIEDNSMEYSAYVLTNRAIPDLRDSCKPVVRRIIYAMHRENATKFTKSATMSGKVMSLHPHSDCYPTIVGMVQKDNQILPWLEGKGNFSQHTSRDLMYASSRYTEVKLSPFTIEVLKGLNNKSVNFIPNYDGTIMMPEVLPVKFPMILHYCQSGIGVGMASNIPSFNMIEIANAIESYINTGEQIDLIPDFATGGQILNNKEIIKKINNQGVGNITLRGKCSIKDNIITIDEIPYSTTREAIIDKTVELIKNGKFKEIININDLTGLKGMSIEVVCKKNADVDKVIQKLYKNTPLECTFSANMNILNNGLPKVMGVWDIINNWLDWRKGCIISTYTEDINILNKKLHLYDGLINIIEYIDEVIKIIRQSKTDKDIIKNLCNRFNIDEVQSEYIADIKIRNLNKENINKTIKDKEDLENKIVELNNIITNDKLIMKVILNEIKSVADTYGKPRRTEIIYESDIQEITKEDLIEDKNVTIILTKQGYLKKLIKNMDSQKLKEDDEIIDTISTTNHSELSLITDKNNMYRLKIWELEEHKPSQLGTYLKNEIKDIESDANIIKGISIQIKNKNKGNVLVCFKNGNVAKIKVDKFKSGVSKAINVLNTESPILKIMQITNDIDLTFLTSEGKLLIINTSTINPVGSKNGKGVRCIKLGDNELVGVMDNITNESVIKVQTEKKDCIDLKLNDNNKNDISYYYSEKRDKQGNFVLNCRQKKDKIIKILE